MSFQSIVSNFTFSGDADKIILFSHQAITEHSFLNHFSVAHEGQTSAKNRAVVTYTGDDTGSGKWGCQKDRGHSCGHIKHARNGLQKLVQANPAATDNLVHDENDRISEWRMFADSTSALLMSHSSTCSRSYSSRRQGNILSTHPSAYLGKSPGRPAALCTATTNAEPPRRPSPG